MPHATWVPAVHFTPGREAPVRRIVLHWMATTLAGCDATFTSGGREASAHYGIENDTIHQYVREADTAWHAGVRAINHESIGIEHSAQPGRDATAQTIATSVALCTELCRRYGLTADAIDQHNDFYATQCPGTLPVNRIREAVRANLAGKPTNTITNQEGDDMSAQDVQQVNDYTRALLLTGYTSGGKAKPSILDVLINIQGRFNAQSTQVAALTAAVKALATSQGVSGDRIEQIVSDAVDAALTDYQLTLTKKETA